MGNRGMGQIGRDFYSQDYATIKEYDSSWIGAGTNKVFNKILDSHPHNTKDQSSIEYYDNENYYITNDVGDGKIINSKNNFLYKINSNGFRSQHFKKVDPTKTTILTGGCSCSFGEGVPEEVRWQSFLLKNLNDNDIELFDVSSMGASCRLVIRNVISFIRNYGKPDYILLYLPDVARDFWYNEELSCFQNVNVNSEWLIKKDKTPELFKTYTLSFNEYNSVMSYVEHMWALEELCELAGIKLIWATWVPALLDVIEHINFKNFVIFNDDEPNRQNIDNFPYWDCANDERHPGSKQLSWVGSEFGRLIKNG
jgi:hypothetical protein